MPKLIVLTEGIEPTSFEFTKEAASVGRDDENDITLPHQSVSGSHAELVMRGEDVHVRDLGSTNGTYINGNKVAESPLQPSEVITFGEVELKLDGPRKAQSHDKHLEQGVRFGNLDSAPKGPAKGFSKKSDKSGRYFVIFGVVVAVVIIGALIMAWMKFK
ncbi:MAG: FHA domain-containing protein [Verrucomicrobiota bacterium]|jgi:pSer/pThr/pTyr-binding forkhead associated (FHA) protein|nr:FHA domain-containing protein [Verrucomicrobiota bacterium]